MNEAKWAFLGAALGGLIALAGAFLISVVQGQRENRKEFRERLGEVARSFAAVQQEMEWMNWYGVNDPAKLNEKLFDDYLRQMKQHWPAAVASISVIASYDYDVYKALLEEKRKLEEIDEEIYRAPRDGQEARTIHASIELRLYAAQGRWSREIASSMSSIR